VQGGQEVILRYILGLDTIQTMFTRLKFTRGEAAAPFASAAQLESDVSAQRGLKTKQAVPFQYITPEEMAQHWKAAPDSERAKATLNDQEVLTLLGVLKPGTDLNKLNSDLLTDSVVGFYTPKDKKFYVLKDGEQSAVNQMTVAHEYVHALQDQNFDLTKLDDACGSEDACDAVRALAEGDATMEMILYTSKYLPIVDVMQAATAASGVKTGATNKVPTFLTESGIFPYNSGLNFVYKIYQNGGWKSVDALYAKPPQSTEQILHPELYRDSHSPVKVTVPDLAASLKGDWKEVKSNVMGELGWQLTLAEQIGPGAAAPAAKGWGGDVYVLLRKGDSNAYVLVARTLWDTQDDADEFNAAVQVWMRHRTGFDESVKSLVGDVTDHLWTGKDSTVAARQKERYVTLVIGTDPDAVKQVAELLNR
jgi:hypothetical protein